VSYFDICVRAAGDRAAIELGNSHGHNTTPGARCEMGESYRPWPADIHAHLSADERHKGRFSGSRYYVKAAIFAWINVTCGRGSSELV